ncbi:MAG: hypothetical protein Q7J67_03210 [bacterium]|nr:hypothetical protein [bacterium]
MNNFHPEDRLLRLIRGEKKEQTGSRELVKFSVRSDRLKQVLSILKTKPVMSINQILSVVVFVLLIYAAYIWIRPGTSEEILIPSSRVVSLKSIEKKQQIDLKIQNLEPSSFYSSMAKKRNLFKQLTASPVILPEVGIDMKQLVKDLNLVGIVLDESPQAIIENGKTKSVHYVNEGSTVGELKVSKISESSVTLSYGTETIDLFL